MLKVTELVPGNLYKETGLSKFSVTCNLMRNSKFEEYESNIIIKSLDYRKIPFMFLYIECEDSTHSGYYVKVLVFDKVGLIFVSEDERFEELK